MNKWQRTFAVCGGICGVVYLFGLLHPLPDFLRGFALGLAMGFLILSLLPEAWVRKLKRWKRCGK